MLHIYRFAFLLNKGYLLHVYRSLKYLKGLKTNKNKVTAQKPAKLEPGVLPGRVDDKHI